MLSLDEIKRELREYDGTPVAFMEVCGTHTGEISKNGIVSMLSPKIRLVSGPVWSASEIFSASEGAGFV